MVELNTEEAYRLMELKTLEGIEGKLWLRLRRYTLYLTIPVLLVTFFGIKSFSDWVKATIDDRVKLEVSSRLKSLTDEVQKTVDSQRTKLEAQIEKTSEASIFARATTEEARRTLNELRSEARASETSVVQLRNDATATIKDLTGRFNSQKEEIQKLNSYVKTYYEGRRTGKLRFKQTPDLLAVPTGQKLTLVVIRLSKIPIANSLSVQYHLYTQPPDSYFVLRDSVIVFVWSDSLQRLEQQSLYITYAPNPEAGEGFKSLTAREGRIYGDDKELFGLPPSGG